MKTKWSSDQWWYPAGVGVTDNEIRVWAWGISPYAFSFFIIIGSMSYQWRIM